MDPGPNTIKNARADGHVSIESKNESVGVAGHMKSHHFWLPENNHRFLAMKPLTPRERKILEFIGQGYSSGQIACTLSISPHTVETHRKSLLLKLEARNAAELMYKSIQRNILSIT